MHKAEHRSHLRTSESWWQGGSHISPLFPFQREQIISHYRICLVVDQTKMIWKIFKVLHGDSLYKFQVSDKKCWSQKLISSNISTRKTENFKKPYSYFITVWWGIIVLYVPSFSTLFSPLQRILKKSFSYLIHRLEDICKDIDRCITITIWCES